VSPRTRTALPTIEPIVPVAGSAPLNDPRWIYEPKFDGFRGVLYLCRGECYVRSKRNNVLRRFAEFAQRIRDELEVKDAILDGEVVSMDDEGRMDFRALLAGKGWLHYAAFDLLWLNGKDLRAQQLIKRKRRLEQLIPANNSTLSRVLAVEEARTARPSRWHGQRQSTSSISRHSSETASSTFGAIPTARTGRRLPDWESRARGTPAVRGAPEACWWMRWDRPRTTGAGHARIGWR
jgi:ATP-dependent DNA ligase